MTKMEIDPKVQYWLQQEYQLTVTALAVVFSRLAGCRFMWCRSKVSGKAVRHCNLKWRPSYFWTCPSKTGGWKTQHWEYALVARRCVWQDVKGKNWVQKRIQRTSLAIQWLDSTAGDTGSVPGWGTKIPHAGWCSQKILINLNFFLNLSVHFFKLINLS